MTLSIWDWQELSGCTGASCGRYRPWRRVCTASRNTDVARKTEKERVKGIIINKFRGDKTILDPGVVMLEERGHVPVVGVVPYMELSIDDEDSLSSRFDRGGRPDRYCSHPLSKNFQFYGSVCLRADRAGFRALCGQCERLTPPGHDRASGQ